MIDPLDLRTFPAVEPLSTVPETFRQTLLAKSTECMRGAYLYERYSGGPLTPPLAGGTLLHRALERFIRTLFENEERMGTPELAKDILNEVVVESTDLTVPPGRFDSIRVSMYHMAEGFRINPANTICIETPVSLDVNGRKVTGTVDYAEVDAQERKGWIVDYKSAFLNPPKPLDGEETDEVPIGSQEEWEGSFQVILYALACAMGSINDAPSGLSEIEEWVLWQVHPRQWWANEEVPAYREAVITKEALLDWRFYLEAQVQKLEHAFATWEFPAVMGSHCDFCAASAECPIPASLRKYRGEIRTPEDASRAATIRERHVMIAKELWDAIKGYAKATGQPVRYGKDLELAWRTIETEKLRDTVKVPGGRVKGRTALKDNIQRTREWGHPLEWSEYFQPSISTRLMRRRLTDKELKEEENSNEL